MFMSARASGRDIHGPPTADWSAVACSSKLPCSFALMSNSTYSFSGAPIIGSSDLLIRCEIMVMSGVRVSA